MKLPSGRYSNPVSESHLGKEVNAQRTCRGFHVTEHCPPSCIDRGPKPYTSAEEAVLAPGRRISGHLDEHGIKHTITPEEDTATKSKRRASFRKAIVDRGVERGSELRLAADPIICFHWLGVNERRGKTEVKSKSLPGFLGGNAQGYGLEGNEEQGPHQGRK
jgi:hypothetical protein